MAPLVSVRMPMTPEVPSAPWPPLALVGQTVFGSADQAPLLALLRYSVKLNVVPDSSERCTVEIAVDGSFTPEFCEAISGSFHLVILPSKMSAMVLASMFSDFTPDRLKATAIGLT